MWSEGGVERPCYISFSSFKRQAGHDVCSVTVCGLVQGIGSSELEGGKWSFLSKSEKEGEVGEAACCGHVGR